MYHHIIVIKKESIWQPIEAIATLLAVIVALLIATFQNKWLEKQRKSKIIILNAKSFLQDQEKSGESYKQIVMRICVKNTGFEAMNVTACIAQIEEKLNNHTGLRSNFLEVPLYWTHGFVYNKSGVLRNIQKNQIAYLDICSGPSSYKSLELSTPVGGNPDFRVLNPGLTILTLALYQKSGQTFYITLKLMWKKGERPTLKCLDLGNKLKPAFKYSDSSQVP